VTGVESVPTERITSATLMLLSGRRARPIPVRPKKSAYIAAMPIVDVTHGPQGEEARLLRLAGMLPHAVSVAVE
jgi:hypothetical protein